MANSSALFSILSVLSLYSVVVAYSTWTPLKAMVILPGAVVVALVLARACVGSPNTMAGIERNKGGAALPKGVSIRYHLYGMPVSHFVEKVRWCLDLVDAPYEEHTQGGILSVIFLGRSVPWLVDVQSCSTVGNSDEAVMYIGAVHVPHMTEQAQAKARALFLRTPATIQWEGKLNELGHAIQGWAYYYILGNDQPRLFSLTCWGGSDQQVPYLHRISLRLLYPILKNMLRFSFKLNDSQIRDKRLARIQSILEEVDLSLSETCSFITGPDLSYIDITFCALIAPLMASMTFSKRSNWAKGRFTSFNGLFQKCAESMHVDVLNFEKDLRQRPAGRFVEHMYKEYRGMKF